MSHGSNDKSKYCTITDPHGKVLKIENDICSHSISLVTSYHHGIWLFRKFDSDHDEALDYRYNLTVVDGKFSNVFFNYKIKYCEKLYLSYANFD